MNRHLDNMIPSFYVAIDGDNIGRKIEYFIVTDQLQKLTSFSKSYHNAMQWLESTLKFKLNAEIVFVGGDSLLASFSENQILSIKDLESLKIEYTRMSETTLSIGIGETLRHAYVALKLAKAKGRDCIELFEDVSND